MGLLRPLRESDIDAVVAVYRMAWGAARPIHAGNLALWLRDPEVDPERLRVLEIDGDVAAIVATLAAYTGLALAAGMFLRHHYLTALVTSNPNVPASAWITSQWWTKGGNFAFTGLPPMNLLQQFCPSVPARAGKFKPLPGSVAQCLSQHGYTRWTGYQPASRFWTFQLIEGGWLLALSLLLIAATVWLVHRRTA